jgi:hypothetical protein
MTESTGTPEATVDKAVVAPHVGLPARLDMRRALAVYVAGRNRNLDPEAKGAMVGGAPGTPLPGPSVEKARPQVPAAVSVPDDLRFDRNAGTWRRSLVG